MRPHAILPTTGLLQRLLGVALLVSLLTPSAASAQNMQLRSTTYFNGFIRPGNGSTDEFLPLYEQIQLNTRDTGVKGLGISASLWGAINFMDIPLQERRATGDVNVLLLSYHGQAKSALEGLDLRLGRQFVAAGPSVYDQIDGLFVNYRSPYRFDVAAYGGIPTGIRFTRQPWAVGNNDLRYSGNMVVGGRLGYRLMDWANIGASYRHKRYDGEVAFHEIGWDVSVHALKRLTLITDGVFELTAQRIKEARAMLRLDLPKKITLIGGYRYSEPNLFIPRTSIFAVISDWTHQEASLEGYWKPLRWLDLSIEGGALIFGETCLTGQIGGGSCDAATVEARVEARADMRFGDQRQHRVSLVGERLGAPDGGYTRGRVAGAVKLAEKVSGIAEFDLFYLDERDANSGYVDVSGKSRFSFVGSAYFGYALMPTLSVLAGGQAGTSPYLKNYGAFTVRVTWLLDGAPIQGAVRVNRSTDPTLSMTGGVLQ